MSWKGGFIRTALLCVVVAAAPSSAWAKLRVFSCETEWAALAEEIGGDGVTVDSATTARQDVHFIQARPSLISKLRRADLLICSGAELEVGWLPVLLLRASNAKVQPGAVGHVDVSKHVPMLDVPTRVDRAQGDIHPYGNPHTQTDPRNIARVAAVLAKRMGEIDPEDKAGYDSRLQDFTTRWDRAMEGWKERARPLRGMEIITHHVAWVYMANWLDMKVVGHLEPKPGLPPTATHLSHLLSERERHHVRAIVRAVYQSERPSRWLSERSGIPALVLPHTVGATDTATDLFAMFDEMLRLLLEVAP